MPMQKFVTQVETFDDVRVALQQIQQRLLELQSTVNGYGASLIGVEDAGSVWTGTDLETILNEIDVRLQAAGV